MTHVNETIVQVAAAPLRHHSPGGRHNRAYRESHPTQDRGWQVDRGPGVPALPGWRCFHFNQGVPAMGRKNAVTWKAIPGYSDLYEASDDGRVRSWNAGRWGRRKAPHILKARLNNRGYFMVPLGRGNLASVHRLVCAAFNGPPPAGCEVAHHDGNQTNNSAGNLSWKTPIENAADKLRHQTHRSGAGHQSAKLTEDQALQIIALRIQGVRNKDLASQFGVSPQTISDIANRRKWCHLGAEKWADAATA